MKKSLIIFLVLFGVAKFFAQVHEMGIAIGGNYYIGDLNPYKHFYRTKPAGGIFYRNTIKRSDRLSYKINLNYGSVEAYDADNSNADIVVRNLSFKSKIVEIGAHLEINFLPYEIGSKKKPGTPYLFFGIAMFSMNPMGQYKNDWIELQSLRTEGQGTAFNDTKPYKLKQIALPFGVGMKINITSRIAIGLEYGLRKTFTDYLDDVSGDYVHPAILEATTGSLSAQLSDPSLNNQGSISLSSTSARGNPNTKDWYAFAGINLSFRLVAFTTCTKI